MPIADASDWRFVLTDMNGSTAAAGAGFVSNAATKMYQSNLNAPSQAQVVVNVDNPIVNFALANDCLLKVYRRNRLGTVIRLFVGDVISVEEAGQEGVASVTLTAADPWWRLQRRFIGMGVDSIGRGTGYSDGAPLPTGPLRDYTTLANNILSALNSTAATGLTAGTLINTGNTSYVGPVYAQNAGDLLQQFCNTLGGPDIYVTPVEPTGVMPNTVIGNLNIVNRLGTTQTNTVFEYGTGTRNVQSYDRLLTKDGLANWVASPPQGFPSTPAAGDTMAFQQDTTSQALRGFYQDIIQTDVAALALRQQLCLQYVQVRTAPRQQLTYVPTIDCPLDFTVDYAVGDVVTARAYVDGAGLRYNGNTRIYGVSITVDENDAETIQLTLIPGTV